MKFTVSWWDINEGIGIALSETGVECLLHKSNLSNSQCKSLLPEMTITGEAREISSGTFIIEKVRVATKSKIRSNTTNKEIQV